MTKKQILDSFPKKKDGKISIMILKKVQRIFDKFEVNKKVRIRRTYNYDEFDITCLAKFIDFKIKNDYPRGGELGDYIKLNKREYNLLKKRVNYVLEDKKWNY